MMLDNQLIIYLQYGNFDWSGASPPDKVAPSVGSAMFTIASIGA